MVRVWMVVGAAGIAALVGGCGEPGRQSAAPADGPQGGVEAPGGGEEVSSSGGGQGERGSGVESPGAAADDRYVLDFTMNRIDGAAEPLSDYRGRVVLVVNVASRCGLTPQYEALEALYEDKSDEGLVVLGFPANNFNGQEPGTNKEIQEFCTGEYHVTFPMFEKISVLGDDQHPLYGRLSREGGPPSWNFTKYLVDREGRVVARFDPRTPPNDPALLARIDELLSQ